MNIYQIIFLLILFIIIFIVVFLVGKNDKIEKREEKFIKEFSERQIEEIYTKKNEEELKGLKDDSKSRN